MVVEEIVNVTADTLVGDLVVEVGKIGLLLNALGVIIVLWIAFQVVTLVMNRKRRKTLYRIERKLGVLEGKIDKILKKRK